MCVCGVGECEKCECVCEDDVEVVLGNYYGEVRSDVADDGMFDVRF